MQLLPPIIFGADQRRMCVTERQQVEKVHPECGLKNCFSLYLNGCFHCFINAF